LLFCIGENVKLALMDGILSQKFIKIKIILCFCYKNGWFCDKMASLCCCGVAGRLSIEENGEIKKTDSRAAIGLETFWRRRFLTGRLVGK